MNSSTGKRCLFKERPCGPSWKAGKGTSTGHVPGCFFITPHSAAGSVVCQAHATDLFLNPFILSLKIYVSLSLIKMLSSQEWSRVQSYQRLPSSLEDLPSAPGRWFFPCFTHMRSEAPGSERIPLRWNSNAEAVTWSLRGQIPERGSPSYKAPATGLQLFHSLVGALWWGAVHIVSWVCDVAII